MKFRLSLAGPLLAITLLPAVACKKAVVSGGKTIDFNTASLETIRQSMEGVWRLKKSCGGIAGFCQSFKDQPRYDIVFSGNTIRFTNSSGESELDSIYWKKAQYGSDSAYAFFHGPNYLPTFPIGIDNGILVLTDHNIDGYENSYQQQ